MAEKKTTTKKSVKKVEEETKVETPVITEKEAKKAVKKTEKVAKKAAKVEAKEAKKKAKEVEVKPLATSARCVAKNVRVTPRKARLVIDLVRGKSISEAVAILENLNKAASLPVLKAVNSAASNAINNFNLDEDKLFVKTIFATDGIKIKRYLPRAKGSASGLVKRSCNITVVVEEKK